MATDREMSDQQQIQALRVALTPLALHLGPIPSRMAGEVVLTCAEVLVDRAETPVSMGLLDRITALAEALRDEITA